MWTACVFVLLLLVVVVTSAQQRQYYGAIPVPGRSVPTLRFFEHYVNSCNAAQRKSLPMQKLAQLLQGVDAETIAEKVYRQLSFTIDDIEPERLMGRWFVVVDSPGLHADRCMVADFEMQYKTKYTALFSAIFYSRHAEAESRVYHGRGEKLGPDAGNIFLHSGHPYDVCPYFPVKVGPPNVESGRFEYVVWTQPLRYPTLVLARDARDFDLRYRREVEDYLKRADYIAPLASLDRPLQFLNTTACHSGHQTHYELDD